MLSSLSTISCSAVAEAVIMGGYNPDPNLKIVHMATVHDGYTQEDVEQHPDHDCNREYILIKDR